MDDLDRFIASLPLNRQKQIAERVQKLALEQKKSGREKYAPDKNIDSVEIHYRTHS